MPTVFQSKVYELCKKVPAGKVTTYKALAVALGTDAYRAVGSALNKNENLIIIPCHRVVNSDGSVGGYREGVLAKTALLQQEGVDVLNGDVVDFENMLYLFV